jgi:hypothetical protein
MTLLLNYLQTAVVNPFIIMYNPLILIYGIKTYTCGYFYLHYPLMITLIQTLPKKFEFLPSSVMN